MSRNTSLLLDLDLARVLLLGEGNVRIVLHLLFKQLNFKHSRWLRRRGGGARQAATRA